MNKNGYLDEIFVSYQGEGVYVGVKQIFVRFSLCNLKCSFCDTPAAKTIMPGFKLFGKKYINNPIKVSGVVRQLIKYKGKVHSVSLTGGEPLFQGAFATALASELKRKGFKVYLETNGTMFDELKGILPYIDIISMDIKLPSTSGQTEFWEAHKNFLKLAGKKVFVKIVVDEKTKKEEIYKALKIAGKTEVIIQPAFKANIKKMLKLLETSKIYEKYPDIRIIPQIHRFIGIA
jgi:organic radical activating enzyme